MICRCWKTIQLRCWYGGIRLIWSIQTSPSSIFVFLLCHKNPKLPPSPIPYVGISEKCMSQTQFDDGAAAKEAPQHRSHREDQDGQPPSLWATENLVWNGLGPWLPWWAHHPWQGPRKGVKKRSFWHRSIFCATPGLPRRRLLLHGL